MVGTVILEGQGFQFCPLPPVELGVGPGQAFITSIHLLLSIPIPAKMDHAFVKGNIGFPMLPGRQVIPHTGFV